MHDKFNLGCIHKPSVQTNMGEGCFQKVHERGVEVLMDGDRGSKSAHSKYFVMKVGWIINVR